MAAKRKKKKKPAHLDPNEVLSGRVAVTALELVRLIHRINPTDKESSPAKISERYRLKARLQSLLIKKFSRSLFIEQSDPEQPQLIGIKLIHFDEDACHALLHELDSEAASWVRRQIDERPGSSEESPAEKSATTGTARPPADPLREMTVISANPGDNAGKQAEEYSPEKLLKLGHQAIEEYDYEAAEAYFYRAFIAAPNNVEIALNLLEFLIDYLAAYEKVLDYSAMLPARLRKDERVRILRARALARRGKIDEALECLGGTAHCDAAKVYLLGARYFLKKGRIEPATRLLGLLKSFEKAELQLETARLEKDIHQLRIKNLEPLEQEMIAAQQQGMSEKAAQLAQKLLAKWPENKNARQIRHDFSRQRKAAEKSRLLQRADKARSKGDFTLEIEVLKKILAVDKDDKILAQRLAEAENAAEKKREESKINNILKLLDEGEERKACVHYTELNHRLRQRLRDETKNPRFYQLEQIIATQPTLKAEKVVEALLVFGQCRKMLTRGTDPQSIILRLQDHDKILRYLPEAAELIRQAEMISQKLKATRAETFLHQADRQLARENLREARALVEFIEVEALGKDDKKLYKSITAELTHLEEIQRLKEKYSSADNAENHLAARDLARRLALKEPSEATLWRERAALHSTMIKVEWSFVECDVKDLPCGYDLGARKRDSTECCNCLMADGRRLVCVSGYGKWLFVGILRLDRRAFSKAIVLRTPEELSFPEITLANDLIWIKGHSGKAVELSLDPPEILSWHDFTDLLENDDIIEDVRLFPKSEYMWIGVRGRKRRSDDIYKIIKLKQHREERQIKMPRFPITISKDDHFQVVAPGSDFGTAPQTIQIYSEQGRIVGSLPLTPGKIVHAATAHPNKTGYIVLSYLDIIGFDPALESNIDDNNEDNNGDDFDENNFQLTMEVLPGGKGKHTSVQIENSHGEMNHGVYSLPRAGLAFVYCNDNGGINNYQLLTFKFSENQYTRLHQVSAPQGLLFATDESNNTIVAINPLKESVQTVVLGENPPQFMMEPANNFVFGDDLPSLINTLTCGEPTGPIKAEALALTMRLKRSTIIEIVTMIEANKINGDKSPGEINALILALEKMAYFDLARNLDSWFKEKYPDYPRNKMALAAQAIQNNEWQKAVSLLERIDNTDLDEGTACHICHLLGIGLFASGEVEKALRVWEKGASLENGHCKLEVLIIYAQFASMSPEERREFEAENKIFTTLDIYENVDARLRDEDWLAAITIMENYTIASLGDLQILARLSEAYLHYEVNTGEGRWVGKVMVLAKFLKHSSDKIYRKNQILPPYIGTWPETRIQEVARKAARWLDEAG